MKSKKKCIDLVAVKDGRKIAIEIETGKNSRKQLLENIRKCLDVEADDVQLITTTSVSLERLGKLLAEH